MLPLWSFPGGIHPPMHKEESTQSPIVKLPMPKRLVLSLHQHIGAPNIPDVEIGEKVLKGQRIAHADGYVSVALHAPTSGTITDIGKYPVPHPSGLSDLCIVLTSDGKDEWGTKEAADDYLNMDASHLRNRVREAGIVGLGGAGFPSFIKLNPGPHKVVDTLLINGIECEPYISCDDMLMRERNSDIVAGIKIIAHAVEAKQSIIAVEDNKPEAYQAMLDATANEPDISVIQCPTIYPQGSEKQLIYVVTGKEVPSNGLPLNVGIVVHNVGTAAAIYNAITKAEPLISRIVTVTGDAIAKPQNLEVLIGTPIHVLLDFCEAQSNIDQLIMGGPMMGFAIHSSLASVLKTSNCILATTYDELPQKKMEMPCIRCGVCADVCPIKLLPQQLYWHAKAKDFEKTQDYNLFDCIECGCCAYVCPSNIPLVHYYRFAKTEIWSIEREQKKADIARQRHDFRAERLAKEKAEKAARHKRKRNELKEKSDEKNKESKLKSSEKPKKKAAILEAMERVQLKKEANKTEPKNTTDLTEEQQEKINQIDKQRESQKNNANH
ncbi:Electron transport complex protein RnfC [hydrothermal vent metagenome]|uniref:Electron transport complex protein RnfC n=1 Tax=hydrothermal vent metagenome TaxID=652676 RepID=A0A3B0ZJY6_9ZZZZ